MNDKQPSYLITGITGFLGRHTVDAVRRSDPEARIIGLVRDPSSTELATLEYLANVELIPGALTDSSAWKNDPRLEGLAGIFHLGGEVRHSRSHTEPMIHVNVAGTLEMVRLAAGRKCRVVFISTSGTVGCSKDPAYSPDEDAPFREDIVSNWPYYLSKIRAERESRALADELGVELVIARPPVMLGPGDHRRRSTGNVIRVIERRLPFILEGGMHFCDVRDVAQAAVRAMRIPDPRPVYNLPGMQSTLGEFFGLVARHASVEPSWRVLPARLIWCAAKLNEMTGHRFRVLPDPVVIEMAQHHWGLSSRYAASELGYRPRSHDETIADTIEWITARRE